MTISLDATRDRALAVLLDLAEDEVVSADERIAAACNLLGHVEQVARLKQEAGEKKKKK